MKNGVKNCVKNYVKIKGPQTHTPHEENTSFFSTQNPHGFHFAHVPSARYVLVETGVEGGVDVLGRVGEGQAQR